MLGRVGIVIPVYNGERTLRAAVESVRAQTRPPLEVVAVDDGSSDNSTELLTELGVRVVRQANAGVCAARNRGRTALTTRPEYLLFLDQDDVLEPEMLATMEDYLNAHGEAGLVYCDVRLIDADGRLCGDTSGWKRRHAPGPWFRPRLLPDSEPVTPLLSVVDLVVILPTASLFRASVFDAAGGWDESFRRGGAEDSALAVEVGIRAQVHYLPRQLVRYRWHEAQESSQRERLFEIQRQFQERLRQRPEPEIRAALRARDDQIHLQWTVLRAQNAFRRRDVRTLARASGSVGKTAVRILYRRLKRESPR